MTEQETFKAGERVAAFAGFSDTPSIRTVERITPTGIIVIGDYKYNPNGYARGDSGYERRSIRKLTPELERRAIKGMHLSTIGGFNYSLLPDDELARLAGIIAEIRKAAEAKKLFGKDGNL